jgi:two-component system, response regulator PdtaR
MIAIETYSNPAQLWLAAAAAHEGDYPGQQGDDPAVAVSPLRVLIVEDEFFISLDTKALLQTLGHVVVGIAVSADQAVSFAEREQPDVVLMDVRLIGARDGIEAAEEIDSRFGIPSLFVTANTDQQTRQRAASINALGFLEKPLTQDRLMQGLSRFGR